METIKIGIFGIDDNDNDREILTWAIKKAGGEGEIVFAEEKPFLAAITKDIHLVILDDKLLGRSGLELLKVIRSISPASYVIPYNGLGEGQAKRIIEYARCKVDDWVDKNEPGYTDYLVGAIKEGLNIARLRVRLYEKLNQILGESGQ